LSGSGGHIYLRPGGTNDTSGEVVISIDGTVTVNGEPIGSNGGGAADYIVETGEEDMGSNGTWYWEKWNSGKAMCYGIRNFGTIGNSSFDVNGNLYITDMYDQSLPSNLFSTTPYIQASINSFSGVVLPYYVVVVSANETLGTFIIACSKKPTTSLNAPHIGFQAIGRWK
jgi:hypothetical protein